MYAVTKKNQLTETSKTELIRLWAEDYEYGFDNVGIEYVAGKKAYGTKGEWVLYIEGEPAATLVHCDNCDQDFEWMGGNIVDLAMGNEGGCIHCGHPTNEKAQ